MNTCTCTTPRWHNTRHCTCSCHDRIRSDAAQRAAATRRANAAKRHVKLLSGAPDAYMLTGKAAPKRAKGGK